MVADLHAGTAPRQRYQGLIVDTCAGVRSRSDQSVTWDASLPVVHMSPGNCKVVRQAAPSVAPGRQRGAPDSAARRGFQVSIVAAFCTVGGPAAGSAP